MAALPIILDNTSNYIKVGKAGSITPHVIMPNILGKKREGAGEVVVVGEEARAKPDGLTLVEPVKNGIVTDWKAMEKIMLHVFYEKMKIEPNQNYFLVTETPECKMSDRENCVKVLFEAFNIRGLYLALDLVLAVYASGVRSGVAVEVTECSTRIMAVCELSALPRSYIRSNKAANPETAKKVADCVKVSLSMTDSKIRSMLANNIVLYGEQSMDTNFVSAFTEQMTHLMPGAQVKASPDRQHMEWVGASALGHQISRKKQLWISREEFEKHGPTIVHSKCM